MVCSCIELTEALEEIKRLKKENRELKERNLDLTEEVMRLGKIILEQEEDIKDLDSTKGVQKIFRTY